MISTRERIKSLLTSSTTIICLQIILILFSVELLAQAPFIRAHGGDGYDFGAEVIQISEDEFLVAGTTSSFDEGLSSQIYVYSFDGFGIEQWRKTFGGQFADVATSMVQDIDGNFLIAGYTETINNSYQFLAAKINADADTVWTKRFGGTEWDFCNQVVALNDGGFALFGQTFSYGQGNGDFYLIRIDSEGDTLWTRSYGGSAEEVGESISVANDGGFFLAGTTESFGAGGKDMYVVRTDAQGDTLWTRTFGGVEDDLCFAIAATVDGGYVLGGGTYNNTPGELDPILRKEDGSLQWLRSEVKAGDDFITDVLIEPGTENVTAVGQISEGEFGASDGRILRYGVDGVWNGVAKSHGSQGDEHFVDVKRTNDGGYVIVGTTDGFSNRFDDVWIVKTNESGFSGLYSNIQDHGFDPGSNLVAFFPNPASQSTTLQFEAFTTIADAYGSEIHLSVTNALGQLVLRERVTGDMQQIDVSQLMSGIHFYQLVANGTPVASGKLVKVGQP